MGLFVGHFQVQNRQPRVHVQAPEILVPEELLHVPGVGVPPDHLRRAGATERMRPQRGAGSGGWPGRLSANLADSDQGPIRQMANPALVAVDAQALGHPTIGADLRDGDDAPAEVLVVALNGFWIEVEDDGLGAAGRLLRPG